MEADHCLIPANVGVDPLEQHMEVGLPSYLVAYSGVAPCQNVAGACPRAADTQAVSYPEEAGAENPYCFGL